MSITVTVPPPEKWKHCPLRLRRFMAQHHQSSADSGAIVGVDSRTVRGWCALNGVRTARDMPYAAWYTLVHRTAELEAAADH